MSCEGRSWIGCVHPDDQDATVACANALEELFARHESLLLIIAPNLAAPLVTFHVGPCIRSVVLSRSLALRLGLARTCEATRVPELIVRIVKSVDYGETDIRVTTLDALGAPAVSATRRAQWVIPHRGAVALLHRCLLAVQRARASMDSVTVCIDDRISHLHRRLRDRFPDVQFFQLSKWPCGPYVARNLLASLRLGELLVFQDSDDLPTADRRMMLERQFQQDDVEIVGSHELRIDLPRAMVVRYPTDVNAALSVRCGFPQLFATTAVRTEAFVRSGGFSTVRHFGSDTEFLLRNVRAWRMRNVNEVGYVRVMRRGSLSNAHATGLQASARRRLDEQWKYDFNHWNGEKECPLSLRVAHRTDIHAIELRPL